MVSSPVTSTLFGVPIRAADDVWFYGEGQTVLHWNGSTVKRRLGGRHKLHGIGGRLKTIYGPWGRPGQSTTKTAALGCP